MYFSVFCLYSNIFRLNHFLHICLLILDTTTTNVRWMFLMSQGEKFRTPRFIHSNDEKKNNLINGFHWISMRLTLGTLHLLDTSDYQHINDKHFHGNHRNMRPNVCCDCIILQTRISRTLNRKWRNLSRNYFSRFFYEIGNLRVKPFLNYKMNSFALWDWILKFRMIFAI